DGGVSHSEMTGWDVELPLVCAFFSHRNAPTRAPSLPSNWDGLLVEPFGEEVGDALLSLGEVAETLANVAGRDRAAGRPMVREDVDGVAVEPGLQAGGRVRVAQAMGRRKPADLLRLAVRPADEALLLGLLQVRDEQATLAAH